MIDILSEIGEVLCLGVGLLIVFSLLNFLFSNDTGKKTSNKSELDLKPLIPVFTGFTGICIGVFLGNYFSDTWALIGAAIMGINGIIIGISMMN